MTPPGLLYHVTVAFRQGYGETFGARSTALEYAAQEQRKLLAQYPALENEDFAGIYCELQGTQQIWRFEYDGGRPVWMRVNALPQRHFADDPSSARHSGLASGHASG
jgi:hypothetical protein